MVRELLRCGWRFLLRCPGLAKRFPAEPPALVRYPALAGVAWSLTSSVESGVLDPSNPFQATIALDRARFLRGDLIVPLAQIARRAGPIVAEIAETGAVRAEHIVIVVPGHAISDWRREGCGEHQLGSGNDTRRA